MEEKPELLSAPRLEYPPLLSQAGIEGSVVMQFVIDSMGRVEPGSIKVIRNPNPEFERPVRNVLSRALYRPARVHGRAVRVLVQQSFNFTQKR